MKKSCLPNVILIGAQKSGSTTLYDWLSQHPNIYGPKGMKEYNYFSDEENLKLGENWFSKSFKGHKKQKIIIHGYVNYIYYAKQAAFNIYNFNKDIKLILILRNPVDRCYSAYWDARKVALEKEKSFERALKLEKARIKSTKKKELNSLTYLDHGMYSSKIKEYLKFFSDKQIKIVLFDDLKKNPKLLLKDIFTFLEVEKKFVPKLNVINSAGVPRSHMLQNFFQKISIPAFVKPLISAKYTSYIKNVFLRKINIKKITYPEMNLQTRKNLISFYEDEITSLEKLLQINLQHWKN